MPETRTAEVAEIVKSALERDPEQWPAFLEEMCGADSDLRAEVESLLNFQARAHDFIEQPAIHLAAGTFAGDETLKSGYRIGDYEIQSLIGSGGMGEVYLVEDTQLERKVALKLIKRGFGSQNFIRHFREEEKILAALNHPNIAQLYGAGITPEGIPYFAMEYVDGERLDRFCEEHRLDIYGRLHLFRKVCSAVAYAHQNLVIHRDLKPANIRVTPAGEPKLLDFGIAKLLDSDARQPEATISLLGLMTPEYASPEQVRGENMTTASDVYSLGVILYELLTGQRPYPIKGRSPTEIARVISEQEPTRPSTALNPARRDRESGKRESPNSAFTLHDSRLLRGDLDNIVLKALRKEPARRYASVAQLSDDIGRYLDGRPITARKGTFTYRTVKFVKRNKVAATAVALVIVAVTTGLIIALAQAKIARKQRDLARHESLKAERINSFLQRMLSFSNQSITSVWPVAQRRDVTVNDMLDRITPQVEAELSNEPDVRAQVLRTIGSAYASQGQYDAAEKNLRAALALEMAAAGELSADAAATMLELGVLCYRQGNLPAAHELLQKAVAFHRQAHATHSPDYNAASLALALDHLGVVTFYQGEEATAISLLREALQTSSTASLNNAEQSVVTHNKSDLAFALINTGKLDEGEKLVNEAIAEYRLMPGPPRWEMGATLLISSVAARGRNHLDKTDADLREGERILRATLGDANTYLAWNLNQQAALSLLRNDLESAERRAREALQMFQSVSASSFPVAYALWTLGDVVLKAGRASEAEEYHRHALSICEQESVRNYSWISRIRAALSRSLVAQHRLDEAEQVATEAVELARQHFGEDHLANKTAEAALANVNQARRNAAPAPP